MALTWDEVLSPSNIPVFNAAGTIECSIDAEWYTVEDAVYSVHRFVKGARAGARCVSLVKG